MGQALVTLPDGRKARVTYDSPEQLDATVSDLVAHGAQPPQQPKDAPIENPVSKVLNNTIGAVMDPIMHVGSGMVASAVGGLRGLATAAAPSNAGNRMGAAADAVQQTQGAMTYQPSTAAGQVTTKVATFPFELLNKATNYAGEKTSDIAHSLGASPEVSAGLGTAVNTGLSFAIPAKIAKGFKAKEAPVTPEATAQEYVARNLDTPWDSLSDKTKQTLTSIAEDSKRLDSLDSKAVERQARLDALNVPATRGQITRDLPQLTREENITKSDAGQPIRDVNAAQDTRLHELVDKLRADTGSQVTTRQGLGKSVQDEALRAKESASKSNYNGLYNKARATEPDATVPAAPMYELLKSNPEIQHLGWLKLWLDKAKLTSDVAEVPPSAIVDSAGKPMVEGTPATKITREVSLKELDDLRRKASGISKGGGDNSYYAGEVVKAIDQTFEAVPEASKAWTEARNAFKEHKKQFEDQRAVEKLTGNRSRTDRNVALEDTFDQVVLKGSAEDIAKVRESLVSGGTDATRAKGIQAWKDIQAATLDYLKEKAAGKREIVGEKNQLQFNSTFRDAFNELEKDGKIDLVFTPEQAKMLRQINKIVGDVRTKPAGRIAGSDTAPRIMAMLERVSSIPVAGKTIVGAVKAAQMLHGLGKDAALAKKATRSPIDETAAQVKQNTARDTAVKNFSKYIPGTQKQN